MSKTIYKYPIPVDDAFTIRMPSRAHILCVQAQRDEPCIWAIVDPSRAEEPRRFALRGTGHNADGLEGASYVGTFQLRGGALVFHLFEMP